MDVAGGSPLVFLTYNCVCYRSRHIPSEPVRCAELARPGATSARRPRRATARGSPTPVAPTALPSAPARCPALALQAWPVAAPPQPPAARRRPPFRQPSVALPSDSPPAGATAVRALWEPAPFPHPSSTTADCCSLFVFSCDFVFIPVCGLLFTLARTTAASPARPFRRTSGSHVPPLANDTGGGLPPPPPPQSVSPPPLALPPLHAALPSLQSPVSPPPPPPQLVGVRGGHSG